MPVPYAGTALLKHIFDHPIAPLNLFSCISGGTLYAWHITLLISIKFLYEFSVGHFVNFYQFSNIMTSKKVCLHSLVILYGITIIS